ncbi:hypothetical protein EJA71_03415 [Pseudomonas sp. PB106]|nr:hypothetical protein EJA71_03415 [Pseudomonas sp. PB106]
MAFHDRVLQKVVCLSGADLTPRIFYENFIGVMVTIDANDGAVLYSIYVQGQSRMMGVGYGLDS